MRGFYIYSDPLLSLPVLLVPILAGQPLQSTTTFFAITLLSILSLNALTTINMGVTALINYISVFRRVQNVLLLPEYGEGEIENQPKDPNNCLEVENAEVAWKQE